MFREAPFLTDLFFQSYSQTALPGTAKTLVMLHRVERYNSTNVLGCGVDKLAGTSSRPTFRKGKTRCSQQAVGWVYRHSRPQHVQDHRKPLANLFLVCSHATWNESTAKSYSLSS